MTLSRVAMYLSDMPSGPGACPNRSDPSVVNEPRHGSIRMESRMARISATSWRGEAGEPIRLDHQAGAVHIEDPELLGETRFAVVAVERAP